MSAGPSLYRRHRPRTFADVVGQEHVVRTLSHAVERDQIHHAYLFVGSRGTGKTSMAKILAASLNCDSGPTVSPCGQCEACVSIANATSLDVIEMDAASNNSVDDIRALRETVAYAPVSGKHKVYILDEAHMLSTQAWNAFLKTLEEPPARTVFVLATTEANKVLPTVVDRCHRFDFGRPSVGQVATVIQRVVGKEGIQIDDGAVALVARHATGSYRDALGTLEQLVTYVGTETIRPQDVLDVLGVADAEQLFEAVDAIVACDAPAALRAAATLAAAGRDPGQVLRDLESHARELLTVQILGDVPAELQITPDRDARLQAQASTLAQTDAVRLLELVAGAIEASANGAQPRIQLELVLIKAAAPQLDPSTSALLARIERLEKGRGPVATPQAQAPTPQAPAPIPPAPAQPAAEPAEADEYPVDDFEPPPIEFDEPVAVIEPLDSPEIAISDPQVEVEQTTHIPSDSGDLDLPQLQRVWPAVVDMVRAQNGMLAGMIASARPVQVSATEMVLAFPPEAEFQRRKAEQDGHRRATQEALMNVTGVALGIRYELAVSQPTADGEPAPIPEPESLSEDEIVSRFVEGFGAREISETDQESE